MGEGVIRPIAAEVSVRLSSSIPADNGGSTSLMDDATNDKLFDLWFKSCQSRKEKNC